MEFDVLHRNRARLLVIVSLTQQEVGNHVARAVRTPAQVVDAVILRAAGLDVLAGIPVDASFDSVPADRLREVIELRWVFFGAAEGLAVKPAVKGKLAEIRKRSAPRTIEVRHLFGRVAK